MRLPLLGHGAGGRTWEWRLRSWSIGSVSQKKWYIYIFVYLYVYIWIFVYIYTHIRIHIYIYILILILILILIMNYYYSYIVVTETTCETAEIVVLQDCWPRPVQTSLATASALERASQRWRAVGPGSNLTQSSSWSFLGAFFEIQKGSKKGPKNKDFKWICWNKLFAWCYLCFKSLDCTYFICSRFESMDLLRLGSWLSL